MKPIKIDPAVLAEALADDGLVAKFAKASRPIAVTMTVAIPALGAMSIGLVSAVSAARGAAMAVNAATFLERLPVELYGMIGLIATGYIGFKSWETRSPAPPAGRRSPEAAIGDDGDRSQTEPSMPDSEIDGGDYDGDSDRRAVGRAPGPGWVPLDQSAGPVPPPLFDEDAPPRQDPADEAATWELKL